jgi:hypothetical protein
VWPKTGRSSFNTCWAVSSEILATASALHVIRVQTRPLCTPGRVFAYLIAPRPSPTLRHCPSRCLDSSRLDRLAFTGSTSLDHRIARASLADTTSSRRLEKPADRIGHRARWARGPGPRKLGTRPHFGTRSPLLLPRAPHSHSTVSLFTSIIAPLPLARIARLDLLFK